MTPEAFYAEECALRSREANRTDVVAKPVLLAATGGTARHALVHR
jgi:hypothetical protein